MVHHVWFTVLPLHCGKTYTLAFGMDQEWDLMYPLLIKLKYLKRKNNDVVIDRFKLQSLHYVFIGEAAILCYFLKNKRALEALFLFEHASLFVFIESATGRSLNQQ